MLGAFLCWKYLHFSQEKLPQMSFEACPILYSITFKKVLYRGMVDLEMQIEWFGDGGSSSSRNGESKQEWVHCTVSRRMDERNKWLTEIELPLSSDNIWAFWREPSLHECLWSPRIWEMIMLLIEIENTRPATRVKMIWCPFFVHSGSVKCWWVSPCSYNWWSGISLIHFIYLPKSLYYRSKELENANQVFSGSAYLSGREIGKGCV